MLCSPGLVSEISIHALREEGDAQAIAEDDGEWEFLSTPSARRATKFLHGIESEVLDFYPRPPRGGRPDEGRPPVMTTEISIHALREEGDLPSTTPC